MDADDQAAEAVRQHQARAAVKHMVHGSLFKPHHHRIMAVALVLVLLAAIVLTMVRN